VRLKGHAFADPQVIGERRAGYVMLEATEEDADLGDLEVRVRPDLENAVVPLAIRAQMKEGVAA
jgi:hypothetical protein